jgi:hypothetical protein
MNRSYYSDTISSFCRKSTGDVLARLVQANEFALEQTQRDAWVEEIRILQATLTAYEGGIYFEYAIPRMGRRIDVVLLIKSVIFVLEFKVGEHHFPAQAIDQVWDYALDLQNFHEPSHTAHIIPILIATLAKVESATIGFRNDTDRLLLPIKSSPALLKAIIEQVLALSDGPDITADQWESGRYQPVPTIIEAAIALYSGHSVSEISRSDAGAINLRDTAQAIGDIIVASRRSSQKAICFVTGVPGAGKTLVGLNVATTHIDKDSELYSVFLSGNGPLVAVLREALARDQVQRAKQKGDKVTKSKALSEVKLFVQNVHNFRDECLIDESRPPLEHVALFDEAQRAWDKQQTATFMRQKRNIAGFALSEPEFLISCLDRHPDWAIVVCLVGGGQEINTGEAGISEWLDALKRSFSHWCVYISPHLYDSEYAASATLRQIQELPKVFFKDELHLSVSLRSFRAEKVSLLIKQILDIQSEEAAQTLAELRSYPIVLTRDLVKAKRWLKEQARGSERYGLIVSSQALRLKPHAIDVRSPVDPIHWFLDGKEDTRSSYYLEDVATEFQIQGLELDWVCVTWDADFRFSPAGWLHWSFVGSKWTRIHKSERQQYLKNAYRVLLTRARQGMVIVVPPGDEEDATRKPEFYDETFEYLRSIGLSVI